MTNNDDDPSRQYRLFCRIVCPGLILLGLLLLAISFRTSQLTCQRSTGQCAITHSGILPAPKITFELGYLGRVLVEETDMCCSSDNPVWYNLTIEAGNSKKSYRLLYAWVDWNTAHTLLQPAKVQSDEFATTLTIPELTIRLPDNRREDLFCGLYFLVAGLIYTLINARVIFPGRLRGRSVVVSPDLQPVEPLVKKGQLWRPVRIWLLWTIVPPIGWFVCQWAYNNFYSLIFCNCSGV